MDDIIDNEEDMMYLILSYDNAKAIMKEVKRIIAKMIIGLIIVGLLGIGLSFFFPFLLVLSMICGLVLFIILSAYLWTLGTPMYEHKIPIVDQKQTMDLVDNVCRAFVQDEFRVIRRDPEIIAYIDLPWYVKWNHKIHYQVYSIRWEEGFLNITYYSLASILPISSVVEFQPIYHPMHTLYLPISPQEVRSYFEESLGISKPEDKEFKAKFGQFKVT